MEYFLTEQQKTIRSLARRIAEERILPVRAELDEKEDFPWGIMKDLADSDMFRVFIPVEFEGLGGGTLELFRLAGQFFRRGGHLFCCSCVLLDDLIQLLNGLVDLVRPVFLLVAGGIDLLDQVGRLLNGRHDL